MESRALDTLKFAIAQLLAEFDKENPVFDSADKSKRAQIEGLMSLLEGKQLQKAEE